MVTTVAASADSSVAESRMRDCGEEFLLAHLSDPHLAQPLVLSPTDLLRKRLIGFLSWRLRRQHIHRQEVLTALTRDLLACQPDHIAVTGDIVNISLASEFAAAAAWLAALGPAERVSVVPGNHDAYVRISVDRSWAAWRAYMTSDPDRTAEADADCSATIAFPFVRQRGPIALVGLTTAVATLPGLASGILGRTQLTRAETALTTLGEAGRFRVILIHHPPVAAPGDWLKRLVDAEAFQAMLARAGAELILHGHDHYRRIYELPGRSGAIPVVGVASASALPVDGQIPAQYHLFKIARSDAGWSVDLTVRSIDRGLRMHEAAKRRFRIERPTASTADAGAGATF
jgi:3',5'-cyclic AMP phosphodiesterase CpdA